MQWRYSIENESIDYIWSLKLIAQCVPEWIKLSDNPN